MRPWILTLSLLVTSCFTFADVGDPSNGAGGDTSIADAPPTSDDGVADGGTTDISSVADLASDLDTGRADVRSTDVSTDFGPAACNGPAVLMDRVNVLACNGRCDVTNALHLRGDEVRRFTTWVENGEPEILYGNFAAITLQMNLPALVPVPNHYSFVVRQTSAFNTSFLGVLQNGTGDGVAAFSDDIEGAAASNLIGDGGADQPLYAGAIAGGFAPFDESTTGIRWVYLEAPNFLVSWQDGVSANEQMVVTWDELPSPDDALARGTGGGSLVAIRGSSQTWLWDTKKGDPTNDSGGAQPFRAPFAFDGGELVYRGKDALDQEQYTLVRLYTEGVEFSAWLYAGQALRPDSTRGSVCHDIVGGVGVDAAVTRDKVIAGVRMANGNVKIIGQDYGNGETTFEVPLLSGDFEGTAVASDLAVVGMSGAGGLAVLVSLMRPVTNGTSVAVWKYEAGGICNTDDDCLGNCTSMKTCQVP